jgi:tetratricopeptide (TPR) repeat protein
MKLEINPGFGVFEINSDDFTKIVGNGATYYDIAAESIKEAYNIRNKRFPKLVSENNVYYQVRTIKDDIIGRDRLGDYEDIISEPTMLDEIRKVNLNGVKKWIDYGVNLNSLMGQTPNSFSPLILACQKGNYEIVKLLINNGADVNLVGDPAYQTTPLIENCRQGNLDIFHTLIKHWAETNYTDAGGWTPLMYAEHFKHDEIGLSLATRYLAKVPNIREQAETTTNSTTNTIEVSQNNFKLLEKYLAEATQYEKSELFDKAINAYTKCIKLNLPHSEKLYLMRGKIYGDNNEYDKAMNDFNIVIEINPELSATVYYLQGQMCFNQKKFDDAIILFNKALNNETIFGKRFMIKSWLIDSNRLKKGKNVSKFRMFLYKILQPFIEKSVFATLEQKDWRCPECGTQCQAEIRRCSCGYESDE